MKFIVIILILFSTEIFGQTNYNTIMAPKIDSLQKVNLRIKKKEKLETIANVMFAAGVLSTMVMYNIEPKAPMVFIVPVSLCVGGFIVMGQAARFED